MTLFERLSFSGFSKPKVMWTEGKVTCIQVKVFTWDSRQEARLKTCCEFRNLHIYPSYGRLLAVEFIVDGVIE